MFNKIVAVIIGICIFIGIFFVLPWNIYNHKYERAIKLLDSGDIVEAAILFYELGNFRNSKMYIWEISHAMSYECIPRSE